MSQISRLRFPVLISACVMLAACSDADWENAMSYLPLERAQGSVQTDVPMQTASTAPPVATAEAAPAPKARPAFAQPAPSPSVSTPVALADASRPAANEHCRAVATQRTLDGQYMGMSEDDQRQEYERTYADCAAWDAAHGGWPSPF